MLYSGDPGLIEAEQALDLDQLEDYDDLRAVYRWWQLFKPAPTRRRIDPTELPASVLSRTVVLDYDPPDIFRTRLAGTGVCVDRGRELCGRTIEEIHAPDDLTLVKRPYLSVVKTWLPDLRLRRYRSARGVSRTYARLALPLSDDGAAVTGLLVCADAIIGPRKDAADQTMPRPTLSRAAE